MGQAFHAFLLIGLACFTHGKFVRIINQADSSKQTVPKLVKKYPIQRPKLQKWYKKDSYH